MFYVYVILDKNKNIYIGQTSNLKRRFYDHVNKKVKSTKRFTELEMFITEVCLTRSGAMKKEKYYKSYKGRLIIRFLLENNKLCKYRNIL